jgi:F-type H+-transporting ATPase subunit b
MIALDVSVFIQIAAFLILWFLLNKLLFRPYLVVLDAREKSTEGAKAETASLLEEGNRLQLEYDGAIARARQEGAALKDALYTEAIQSREQILAQARKEAADRIQAARLEIEKELQRGREIAAREAEGLARQMAEKILGRRVE